MSRGTARRLCRPVLLWVVLGIVAVGQADAASSPRQPVSDFEAVLIEVMQTSVDSARRAAIAAMLERSFDMGAVSRATIGKYWDGLPAPMRTALTQRIRDYAIAVLADRFVGYDGERFQAQDESELGASHARVRSRFLDAAGEPTQLDYVVRTTDAGSPRIVNVYFDGVSGTDIQKREFEVFLRDGGAQALLARIDALIADLDR